MKVSRTKFVTVFLISAFAFQFISNSILGAEVGLFPANGDWFPGSGSTTGWKSTLAAILYPLKFVLIRPLAFLGQDPDPAPPVMLIAFGFYWSIIALILHFLLSRMITLKKENG
jgi:hypothetical protein